MFPGSPIRAIMDNAGTKLPSGASGWGSDMKTQPGFGNPFGGFGGGIFKPRPRPGSSTMLGGDSSSGGSNVFR